MTRREWNDSHRHCNYRAARGIHLPLLAELPTTSTSTLAHQCVKLDAESILLRRLKRDYSQHAAYLSLDGPQPSLVFDNQEGTPHLSPAGRSTTSGYISLDIFQRLSGALRLAVRRRYLEFNPCETVSRPVHDKSKKKPAPRPEQIARLLRQIESERWGTAVVIAAAAGLRKSEVLALKWEDIEWKVEDFPGFGEVNIAR